MRKKKVQNIKFLSSHQRSSKRKNTYGILISENYGFRLRSKFGDYTLLPQAKIFICYSSNTSEEVLSLQNELLIENLKPKQIIDWRPMAWNAVGNVATFGEKRDAQSVIDNFANEADHIVFVVKDKICEGLFHEWELWTSNPNGKQIYLFIYDNENIKTLHDKLDPSKKIIYYNYHTSNDILARLLREIQPELEISLENKKLSFVRTPLTLQLYEKALKLRITELKSCGHNNASIERLEKHLIYVEQNQQQIINRNKKIMIDLSVGKPDRGQFTLKPIHIEVSNAVLGSLSPTMPLREMYSR